MKFVHIISIILYISVIFNIVKSIKKKNYIEMLSFIFILPFLFFFDSSIILGGSAYNKASTEYELYEVGKYYLESHNNYTEVTKNEYQFMKFIEIFGLTSFVISFILAIVINVKKKQAKEQK